MCPWIEETEALTSVCTAAGRCFLISRTTLKRLKLGGIVWGREGI